MVVLGTSGQRPGHRSRDVADARGPGRHTLSCHFDCFFFPVSGKDAKDQQHVNLAYYHEGYYNYVSVEADPAAGEELHKLVDAGFVTFDKTADTIELTGTNGLDPFLAETAPVDGDPSVLAEY